MRTTLFSVLVTAACVTACSGSRSAGSGTGGGATGSTSSTLSASSSGHVPPTPDGAYVLTLVQDDPAACALPGHTASVGEIDASMRSEVVTDGVGGTRVDCTVSGASSFQVHGVIDDTLTSGNYMEIVIPSIMPGASQSAPAAGSLIFAASWTADNSYSGSCSFYFSPSTPETVDSGKVWVTFACPALTAGMSTCPIKIGYAIFENCAAQ